MQSRPATYWLEDPLQQSEEGLWLRGEHKEFGYSDGGASERYLAKVLANARNLSSASDELEGWIVDWPSRYHLSQERSALLQGFEFRPGATALEVGCGCGAITRYLGETFDEVLAVEGSLARAQLARMRCRDLQNVSIVCAPFHELTYRRRFDFIFCIGVFEYSRAFVTSPDPYDTILQRFRDLLTPDGVLVLAIENQFGLKYFSHAKEDHTNVKFDGVEGYPRFPSKARTFGYAELKGRLGRYFKHVSFYFPYPDYKVPRCIVSERLFDLVQAGELLGRFFFDPKASPASALFDPVLTLMELARNNQLPFFANSFLVLAGNQGFRSVRFDQLAQFSNSDRLPTFRATTRVIERDGHVSCQKRPMSGASQVTVGPVVLRECVDDWIPGHSIQTHLLKTARSRELHFDELFAPCRVWLRTVLSFKLTEPTDTLPGRCLDATWSNSFLSGSECRIVDLEWEWKEPIPLNVLVIRAAYNFLLASLESRNTSPLLNDGGAKSRIKEIGQVLGLALTESDFDAFVELESTIGAMVYGRSRERYRNWIRLFLFSQRTVLAWRRGKSRLMDARSLVRRAMAFVMRIIQGARVH